MSEIVSLNKVRKSKAKAVDKQQAAANRTLHGLPKAAKKNAMAEARKAAELLDGKKLK